MIRSIHLIHCSIQNVMPSRPGRKPDKTASKIKQYEKWIANLKIVLAGGSLEPVSCLFRLFVSFTFILVGDAGQIEIST